MWDAAGRIPTALSEAVLFGEKMGISKDYLLDTLPNLIVSAPVTKAKAATIKNDNYELLYINAETTNTAETIGYIEKLIKEYKLPVNSSRTSLLKNLLYREDLNIIDHEIQKLSLLSLSFDRTQEITDDQIYSLLNLNSQQVINNLIEAIIYRNKIY